MHPSSYDFVAAQVTRYGPFERVLEIGSRNINGSVRDLFEDTPFYLGIDVLPGPGVDRIIHAADFKGEGFTCVVSTNAGEHDPRLPETLKAAWRALVPGGYLIWTGAGPWFGAHSGVLEQVDLVDGEHYEDLTVGKVEGMLDGLAWDMLEVSETPGGMDVTVIARKAH